MITGEFTEDNQIIVKLILTGSSERSVEIETILDTGFSEHLIVPLSVIQQLELEEVDTVQAVMADGRAVGFSVCDVGVDWDEGERNVPVLIGGSKALLGMALLRGSLGTFEFFPGGLATIEAAE